MAELTNWQKWRAMTDGLPSPDNYIDWTWFYTIAASLQRRVWLGGTDRPCYPNMYVLLVGPPGVGKGLPIKEVTTFLKHWPLDISSTNSNIIKTDQDKLVAETVLERDISDAQKATFQGNVKGQEIIPPSLIPVCADAITYEALIQAVGFSLRRIQTIEVNGAGIAKLKTKSHSSLCFVLPELSSLLRKRTTDTVNFMLGLYDCPEDYEYVTKTQLKDRIRKGCLNILAGTTPNFIQSTFDEDLIGEGFTSRTFFVHAMKNRKNVMFLPDLTLEQKQHKTDLLNHIKKLTTLYGPVKIEPATQDFLSNWWDEYETDKRNRNQAVEMIPYYARKNVHVLKLAMAKHFSEDAEQDSSGHPLRAIPIETFKWAIEFLNREEKNMHLGITLIGNSTEGKIQRKILEMLKSGQKNYVQLAIAIKPPNRKDLDDQLDLLTVTNQITTKIEKDEDLDTQVTYWRLI